MSGDIRTGRKARKIMTVFAAVFAVAVMLAVPLLSAVDSEASFTSGEAGYCVTATNATDTELSNYGLLSKEYYLANNPGTVVFMKIFNLSPLLFTSKSLTAETYNLKSYDGMKIESDRTQTYSGHEYSFEKVSMEYTSSTSGTLLIDESSYDDYNAAIAAIKAEFGNIVSVDDKLTITGTIKNRIAGKNTVDFAKVDDTNSVVKGSTNTVFAIFDIDVTITFKHLDSTKSVTFTSSQKFQVDTEATYDYKGKAYSDLKEGDKYDVSYMDKYYFESGSSCYKVDGTEYKIDIKKDPSYPETDQPVVFATDANVQYRMNLLKAEIELLPASAGNVTIGKSFSDVDSAYTDVMAAVAIDDIMKIVLIVIGVIVAIAVIIALIIVVLIVKKSKKKQ